MRWNEFANECPEFATLVRDRFEREQIFLVGTLRPDGVPRISGLECDFVDDELMSGMIWQSAKARDLLRDGRMTIHSLVPDKTHESENEGDVKIYGRGIAVTDPDRKQRYEEAIEARINWRPPEPYHCFAFDLEQVGMVRFGENTREVWTWRPGQTLNKRVLPELLPE
jgi:hypothetical protein